MPTRFSFFMLWQARQPRARLVPRQELWQPQHRQKGQRTKPDGHVAWESWPCPHCTCKEDRHGAPAVLHRHPSGEVRVYVQASTQGKPQLWIRVTDESFVQRCAIWHESTPCQVRSLDLTVLSHLTVHATPAYMISIPAMEPSFQKPPTYAMLLIAWPSDTINWIRSAARFFTSQAPEMRLKAKGWWK